MKRLLRLASALCLGVGFVFTTGAWQARAETPVAQQVDQQMKKILDTSRKAIETGAGLTTRDRAAIKKAVDALVRLGDTKDVSRLRSYVESLERRLSAFEKEPLRGMFGTDSNPSLGWNLRLAEQVLRGREVLDGKSHPALFTSLLWVLRDGMDPIYGGPLPDKVLAQRHEQLRAVLSQHMDLTAEEKLAAMEMLFATARNANEAIELSGQVVALSGEVHGAETDVLRTTVLDHSVKLCSYSIVECVRLAFRYFKADGSWEYWTYPLFRDKAREEVAPSLGTIREIAGEEHPLFVHGLMRAGSRMRELNLRDRAEAYHLEAGRLVRRFFKTDAAIVKNQALALAQFYFGEGRFADAELTLVEAEKRLADAEPKRQEDVLELRGELATVFARKGDYAGARKLDQEGLAYYEKKLKATGDIKDKRAADSYRYQLEAYDAMASGKTDKDDVASLERQIKASEHLRGHSLYVEMVARLALARFAAGDKIGGNKDRKRALQLLESLERDTRTQSDSPARHFDGHVDAIEEVVTLLYFPGGSLATAEKLLEQVRRLDETQYGPDHRKVGHARTELADVCLRQGKQRQGLEHLTRAYDIYARVVADNLRTGTAAQRLAFLRKYYSFMLGPMVAAHSEGKLQDFWHDGARLAYNSVLLMKGRPAEATVRALRTVRTTSDEGVQQLRDRLRALMAEAANTRLVGPGAARPLEQALGDIDEVEQEINREAAGRTVVEAMPTLEMVTAKLPPRTLLLEYVRFDPVYNTYSDQPAYAVYALDNRGVFKGGRIGDSDFIDTKVQALRKTIQLCQADAVRCRKGEWDQQTRAAARALAEELYDLLDIDATKYDRLVLAPDGILNLVPFAALVDKKGAYLADKFVLTYVSTGRDLLTWGESRHKETTEPAGPPLLLANPDFGRAGASPAAGALAGVTFEPLTETAREAEQIAKLLVDPVVLTGNQATERALRNAKSPVLLHVATHGIFLGGSPAVAAAGSRGLRRLASQSSESAEAVDTNLAMLSSGLAFAAANERGPDGLEDGLVSAMELAGLDLEGTQLAVLSACDTGVGEVAEGDGVYGLRRALALAGVQRQVISLWQVEDRATQKFMVAFYTALGAGHAIDEAMKQAEKALRAEPAYAHPYYWAAFQSSGDWSTSQAFLRMIRGAAVASPRSSRP